jgi:hypothetical protein
VCNPGANVAMLGIVIPAPADVGLKLDNKYNKNFKLHVVQPITINKVLVTESLWHNIRCGRNVTT